MAGLFPEKALRHWLVVLGATAAGLILGYIGLHEYLSQHPSLGRSWTDVLFYDLQLFVLNSAPADGAGPFPVALGVARFLAPAATIAATFEGVRLLLNEQLRRWSSPASASKHAIVTGDGPVALELARKLRAEYAKVVLVSTTPATEQVRANGLLDVSGDPTEAVTLRAAGLRRADVLYACAELSTTNAATALRAREISRAHGRPLIVFAQVRDAEVYEALRARRIGAKDDPGFRLDFFSVEDIAARVLLDKHPLAPDRTRPARVVIVGFGLLGRAVLREIARRPHPDGSPPQVSIRGAGTEALSDFLDRFPEVRRNCSVTCDDDGSPWPLGDGPALIFICLPDKDDALNAGLAAAHAMTARSDRVVICMSEPSPFGAVLSSQKALLDDVEGRLTVFEVIAEACVPGRIREGVTDQVGRAIHWAYVKNCAARGDSPHLNHSMRPWEDLPDHLKQSNLAQAANIGAKLDAIDCAVVPESAANPDFAFSAAEIELLAEMEHRRWVDERKGWGIVYGPVREGNQHPGLVDWQYLTKSAQDKDRDAIRALPMILRQAGFQILRLPPSPRHSWRPAGSRKLFRQQ